MLHTKRRLIQTALILATALLLQAAVAQAPIFGKPMRVSNPASVPVLIERLDEDAATIGLTESRIRNRIELHFLRNGINYTTPDSSTTAYLYVNFNILRNAANIRLSFSRPVTFEVERQTYRTYADTWSAGGAAYLGTLDSSDAAYLLDRIDELIEDFLVEFLRNNR